MKISQIEKLILLNQYEILIGLYPENKKSYINKIKILENNYECFYESLIQSQSTPSINNSDLNFIRDILDFYRVIHYYKKDNEIHRKEIEDMEYSYFNGFDGNNELKFKIFCEYLINDRNEYIEQKEYFKENDDLNSHQEMIKIYNNIIKKWKLYDKNKDLNLKEIKSIIQENINIF